MFVFSTTPAKNKSHYLNFSCIKYGEKVFRSEPANQHIGIKDKIVGKQCVAMASFVCEPPNISVIPSFRSTWDNLPLYE